MKKTDVFRKRCLSFMTVMAVLLVLSSGLAFASSGGGHDAPTKKWEVTDSARVLNFVVLAIAMVWLFRKFGVPALNSRIKGIKDDLDELEAKKNAANEELAQYRKQLKLLDNEAEKIIAEYTRQGEDAKERILKETSSAADKLKEQATRNVEYEFARAKQQLQKDVVEKALIKAEQIIKARISENDQDRLVDEYLEKVVAA